MDNYMIALMVFIAFIFGSRIIIEKANKKLTNEKKVELIDLFSNSRIISYILILVMVGVYFLVIKYKIFEPLISMSIYITMIVAYIVFNVKTSYNALKLNEFPDTFITSYLLSSTLRILGILIFFAQLVM